MPLNSNQTTVRLYGSGSKDTKPNDMSLAPRELFVNTFNAYFANHPVAISNGGSGWTDDDVGRVGTLNLPNLTPGDQLRSMTFVIDTVDEGVVTAVTQLDHGEWINPPTDLTGTTTVSGGEGTGLELTITIADNPLIAEGGGLFVGDAVDPFEVVKLTGSLAAQDHDNVNIVGGVIDGVVLNNATISANEGNTTALNGAQLSNSTITTSNITNSTIIDTNLGTAEDPIEDFYVVDSDVPSGITSSGVLVRGSDGKVYVTNTPVVDQVTVNNDLLVINGGVAVGKSTFNTVTGTIVAAADITAFG